MTTNEHPLTAEDVAAIRAMAPRRPDHKTRHAIVADYRAGYGHAITIIETRTMPEGTDPPTVDRRHRIPATGYNRNQIHTDRGTNAPRLVASSSVYLFEQDNIGRVLANIARPGDQLGVKFEIGNDTEPMRAAGFTRDECYVTVARRGKVIASLAVDITVGRVDGWSMVDRSYRPERDQDIA